MSRIIYLHYKSGSHPSLVYQAEAMNARLVYYLDIPSTFKKYELVLSEGFRPLIKASFMRRVHLTRRHINIFLGDFIPSMTKGKKGYLKEFVDFLIQNGCDGLVAISTLAADFFKKYFRSLPHSRIEICWPGLNTQFIRSRELFELADIAGSMRICVFQDLSYLEGADRLLPIFCALQREFRNITMYVIGNGNLAEQLIQESKKIHNFHVFIGYQPYGFIKGVMRRCRIFLFPARLSFFGLPVIEAMSMGLVPVVTEMTGCKDFVEKVDPALVVPSSTRALIRKMTELLSMSAEELNDFSVKAKE